MTTAITDQEFLELLKTEKNFVEHPPVLPYSRSKGHFKLVNKNHQYFFLDINKSGIIALNKFTLQTRYSIIPLVRLDINSPPHINPDGSKTSRNHIHIYREGYGDAWAYELSDMKFISHTESLCFDNMLIQFCNYCNIKFSQKKPTPR